LAESHPLYPAITRYQAHSRKVLAFQLADDELRFRERLNWPGERQIEDGYAINQLMAFFTKEESYDRSVCIFKRPLTLGSLMTWHRMSPGDPVFVTSEEISNSWSLRGQSEEEDPLDRFKQSLSGTVVESSRHEIKIEFERTFNTDGLWRVDVGFNDVVYRRLEEALRCLHLNVEQQEAASTSTEETVLTGTRLRDVILQSWSPNHLHRSLDTLGPDAKSTLSHEPSGIFAKHPQIQDWVARHVMSPPARLPSDPYLDLNDSQLRAIAVMLRERVSLVQGPPGTGKTHTIISAIRLLKKEFKIKPAILVVAATNAAVDNLMKGLIDAGLSVVRCGSSSRIRPDLKNDYIEERTKHHPLYPDYISTIKKAMQLSAKIPVKGKVKIRKKSEEKAKIWEDCKALKNRILQDILKSADVICSTCIGSASALLKTVDFPIVFHDEGGMSTEPQSLIPLMKGCQHLAMIGDHKQLPPVVTSLEALAGGLGISLFERLVWENQVPTVLLSTQYRMHPLISEFPNKMFYDSRLNDGTLNDQGMVQPDLIAPESSFLKPGDDVKDDKIPPKPVAFVSHQCQQTFRNHSYINRGEAELILRIVVDLLSRNAGMVGTDIGVLAPYAGQVNLLHLLFRLATHGSDRTDLSEGDKWAMDYAWRSLGPLRTSELANVEIRTVDGFEGREKGVIIFSTVRSNSSGHIGFLADPRRHNVGLTRAKRGLIVVGNRTTLENSRSKSRGRQSLITSCFSAESDQVEWAHGVADLIAKTKPPTPNPDPVESLTRVGPIVNHELGQLSLVPTSDHPMQSNREDERRIQGAEAWKEYIAWLHERDLIIQWPQDR